MKSDPIQGILFHERTMRPIKPLPRLRRNISRLPAKLREFHRLSRLNRRLAAAAASENKQAAELLSRLRTPSRKP